MIVSVSYCNCNKYRLTNYTATRNIIRPFAVHIDQKKLFILAYTSFIRHIYTYYSRFRTSWFTVFGIFHIEAALHNNFVMEVLNLNPSEIQEYLSFLQFS